MKNITTIETNCKCVICDKKGFLVYTPDGADFHTCPVCGHYDYPFELDLYSTSIYCIFTI